MELHTESLQKLQREELRILIEFDKVCKQLNINYSISSGTLLGAVRHQGFIPWDDDVDVFMLREDYQKFLIHGQKLLPDNLFIQTHETDKEYYYNFAKIRNTSTILKEYQGHKKNMQHGIFIDVFPIDAVSSNRLMRWLDNQLLTLIFVTKCLCLAWPEKSLKGRMQKILGPIGNLIGTYRLNNLEMSIRLRRNKKGNVLTYGDGTFVPPYRLRDTMLMPIDYFQEFEEVDFENHTFQAIKERDTYLTTLYGDYMQLPSEEKRVPSHRIYELKFSE